MVGLGGVASFLGFRVPKPQGTMPGPSLPADITVGTPAAKMESWGNYRWIYETSGASLDTWSGRGWEGWKVAPGFVYGLSGGSSDFIGSNAEGLGSQYDFYQKQMEPLGGNFVAGAAIHGFSESFIGFYLHDDAPGGGPPYEDWFDNTAWNIAIAALGRVAAATQYMNMTGITFDSETTDWLAHGYAGDTHTAAQNRAQVRLRFNALGQALWGANPDLVLGWYNLWFPDGWNAQVQLTVNGFVDAYADRVYIDAIQGLLEGMQAVGGTGEIIQADSTWYRTAAQTIGSSASDPACYKLNSQGPRAYLSRYWPQSTWDFGCDKVRVGTGFTWRSTDGTGFYNSTEPTDASWAAQLLNSRNRSEGTRRFEYSYEGWPGAAAAGTKYSNGTAAAGSTAAASTTPLATVVPTVSLLAASASGDTVTCRASHPDGIAHVKVYDGDIFNNGDRPGSFIHAMPMTWVKNGGTYSTNFDNAYQDCSLSTPLTAGQRVFVCATSIHDDETWEEVVAA